MKIKKDELAIAILLPLAVGSVASYLTGGAMMRFQMMNKPPLAPPGWLFPVVWTILYVLMGIASYLVYRMDPGDEDVQKAIKRYLLQLGVNFFWSIFFFRFEWYLFSFFWLVLLWIFIVSTMVQFKKLNKVAFYFMGFYLLWVTFAGYLNLGVWFLNK